MGTRTAITFMAISIALLMQTGLCPMCLLDDCRALQQTVKQQEESSCCSDGAETVVNYMMELIDAEPMSDCSSCGATCSGQCYTVEIDMLAGSGFDYNPERHLFDSFDQNDQNLLIAADQASRVPSPPRADLPPPDNLTAIQVTELLL